MFIYPILYHYLFIFYTSPQPPLQTNKQSRLVHIDHWGRGGGGTAKKISPGEAHLLVLKNLPQKATGVSWGNFMRVLGDVLEEIPKK